MEKDEYDTLIDQLEKKIEDIEIQVRRRREFSLRKADIQREINKILEELRKIQRQQLPVCGEGKKAELKPIFFSDAEQIWNENCFCNQYPADQYYQNGVESVPDVLVDGMYPTDDERCYGEQGDRYESAETDYPLEVDDEDSETSSMVCECAVSNASSTAIGDGENLNLHSAFRDYFKAQFLYEQRMKARECHYKKLEAQLAELYKSLGCRLSQY